jgi:hypothetical protein
MWTVTHGRVGLLKVGRGRTAAVVGSLGLAVGSLDLAVVGSLDPAADTVVEQRVHHLKKFG